MLAAQNGHSETVQLLLQNGANIEEKSNVSRLQSRSICLSPLVIIVVMRTSFSVIFNYTIKKYKFYLTHEILKTFN